MNRELDAFVFKTNRTRSFTRPLEIAPDSRLIIMENQGLLGYRNGADHQKKDKLKTFSFRAGKGGYSKQQYASWPGNQ